MRAHPLELVERGVGEHVAADRDLGHRGHVHDRGQAGAVGQADHEQRPAVVEAAFGAAGAAGEMGDLVAQVLAVGEHRSGGSARSALDVLQPDGVGPFTMMSVTPSMSSSVWNLPAWK